MTYGEMSLESILDYKNRSATGYVIVERPIVVSELAFVGGYVPEDTGQELPLLLYILNFITRITLMA